MKSVFHDDTFSPAVLPCADRKVAVTLDPKDLQAKFGGINPPTLEIYSKLKAGELVVANSVVDSLLIDESVLVARPLKELSLNVRNMKLPSFTLIARCIKTLVLGIFRGHLCDHVLLKSKGYIIHSLDGKISRDNSFSTEFGKKYPFLMEGAYVLNPKPQELSSHKGITSDELDSLGAITPDAVRKYYLFAYNFAITDRLESINDLFATKHLTLS